MAGAAVNTAAMAALAAVVAVNPPTSRFEISASRGDHDFVVVARLGGYPLVLSASGIGTALPEYASYGATVASRMAVSCGRGKWA
jgi:hypothetical protein